MSDPSPNQGFVLTRTSRDISGTTEVELWVTTEQGPALLRIHGEQPVFFIDAADKDEAEATLRKNGLFVEIKSLELKDFNEHPVCGVYCPSVHLSFRAQEALQQTGIDILEGDIRLHERYLLERFAYGGIEFVGESVQRGGYMEYTQCRIRAGDFRPELKFLSLDIECDLSEELFSVGLSGQGIDEVLMIGEEEPFEQVKIRWYQNEKALLEGLVNRIHEIDPDVFIGWNLINFDLRILLRRAKAHQVKFNIGRDREIPRWRDAPREKEKGFIFIPGRVAIDGIDSLRSATYSFPSFSLENVSRELLSRGKKVEQDVDDRFAEIKENFLHNKTQLAAYNLEDCRLVIDIFDHTRILDFLLLRGQLTGLELDRAGGSVAAFVNLYLPRLHRAGYIAPNIPGEGGLGSPGGYVMDSRPGLYRNVLVLDFKSLYPSIIRTFKVDPLGLLEGLKNPDDAIEGFRGAWFHREKHFLPDIIKDLWKQRDIAKQQKDQARSQAIKILMNSFYGVLGAGGCRFYDPRLASSITMRGHEILQTTRQWIEEQGYEVIYGDTDSIFVWLEGERNSAECLEIGNHLASMINDRWQSELQQKFQLESDLEMEFETHFSRFLMPTVRGSEAGSKKRYAGLITRADDSGEIKEEMIFKGLENVRTDWTDLAKEFQAELYAMVFHDQDATELIRKTTDDTLRGRYDDKLVYRKQLRRKLEQYQKNVPPHVKAARLADQKNKELGKRQKYQDRGWISYVITLNGPEPLEYLASTIDYQHYIDRQLKPVADGILPFIDMDFESVVSAQAKLF